MLQNIQIMAGRQPERTGSDRAVLDALLQYQKRLLRALEVSLEALDNADIQQEERLEGLEARLKALEEAKT